jgi:hypothetical protein
MDSVHLELQYKWQIRRSPAAPGIWFIAGDFDSCKHVSRETDTDPKQLWPQKTKEQNQKTKNKNKKQNKTKPTKNCSLLIDSFPAAKKPQSKKVIGDGDSVSPLQKGRSCTSGSTRPDQIRPAASSRYSLHHFSSKTIFHPLPNTKKTKKIAHHEISSKTPADQLADSKKK